MQLIHKVKGYYCVLSSDSCSPFLKDAAIKDNFGSCMRSYCFLEELPFIHNKAAQTSDLAEQQDLVMKHAHHEGTAFMQ